jgi:hypothetical protein
MTEPLKSVPPTETSAFFHILLKPFIILHLLLLLTTTAYHLAPYTHTLIYIYTMFRSAILRAAPSFRVASAPLLRPTIVAAARPVALTLTRGYAASAGLSKDDISSRVLEVMKTFEKVDGGKVCPSYLQFPVEKEMKLIKSSFVILPKSQRSIYTSCPLHYNYSSHQLLHSLQTSDSIRSTL